MVFMPESAPPTRETFMAWYEKLVEWSEGHDYDDPANTSPKLVAWYRDMIAEFPAMNGPDGVSDDHPALISGHVTGYTCARDAIYVDFRWNLATEAYSQTLSCAAVHHLGFFDVSADDGAVWLPGANGYRIAHGGSDQDRTTERALADWLSSRT